MDFDYRGYNRDAWDRSVDEGDIWTRAVSPEVIAAARRGDWSVLLTGEKPAPRDWFPADMAGLAVLCLASGGGQQGPVLAAAGANVTVLDNSPKQLAQDRRVAEREQLQIRTLEGDMADLSAFASESFDLVFHPVSNLFVPDVRPVWKEAYRVLRQGGQLLAGFMNPVFYIFDRNKMDDEGLLEVRYSLPYSDLTQLSQAERQKLLDEGWPLEWSHSLEAQIGGQLAAGFVLTGLYEDRDPRNVLYEVMPQYIATRALKM